MKIDSIKKKKKKKDIMQVCSYNRHEKNECFDHNDKRTANAY